MLLGCWCASAIFLCFEKLSLIELVKDLTGERLQGLYLVKMSVFGTVQLQSLTEVSTGIKPIFIIKLLPPVVHHLSWMTAFYLFLNQRSRCAVILNLKGWSLFHKVISCSVLFTVKPWSVFLQCHCLLSGLWKSKNFLLDNSWSSCFVSLLFLCLHKWRSAVSDSILEMEIYRLMGVLFHSRGVSASNWI